MFHDVACGISRSPQNLINESLNFLSEGHQRTYLKFRMTALRRIINDAVGLPPVFHDSPSLLHVGRLY